MTVARIQNILRNIDTSTTTHFHKIEFKTWRKISMISHSEEKGKDIIPICNQVLYTTFFETLNIKTQEIHVYNFESKLFYFSNPFYSKLKRNRKKKKINYKKISKHIIQGGMMVPTLCIAIPKSFWKQTVTSKFILN